MDIQLDIIKKNIDYIILEWLRNNVNSYNLNNDLEFYIFQLRQKTENPVEKDYLDYKLDIWKNIEIKRNEN
jgi:hypothetical protein